MMTPRLQMNAPCTYNLDSVYSIDSSSYMSRSGFLRGIEEAWTDCVKKMYEEFDASFAANEGLAAVVRDLTPSKRHLKVNRLSKRRCSIECEYGGRLYLTATDDDSLIMSFDGHISNDENPIDLAWYDSHEAARFIANAFKAYRMIQKKFWEELNRCLS